ncbi:MAG TPA: response regulator [Nitrospiraceae bacterium]|nr:response regulator [Nitrospiraceae bacterium]
MSRIIVIDDDEAIRLLCLKALDSEHYRVSCTGNPVEALAMLDDEPADLLIVDVLLAPLVLGLPSNKATPHFENGLKVVQAALAKRPTTPVLFMSSHSSLTLLSKGVDGKRWPVLRKPFSPTVLRTEIGIRLEAARDKTAPRRDPRNAPRHSIRCRVDYTGDHEGTGVTQDLSLDGCLLKTDIQVEVGAHLTLQLMLPDRPIAIKVHVSVARWSTATLCGLEFVLIEERGERLLSECLARLGEPNRKA